MLGVGKFGPSDQGSHKWLMNTGLGCVVSARNWGPTQTEIAPGAGICRGLIQSPSGAVPRVHLF